MELLTKLLTALFRSLLAPGPGGRRVTGPGAAFAAAGPLLTPSEAEFHGTLCRAIHGRGLVFAKVRLYDVARPTGGDGQTHALAMRQHLDFVICDPRTLQTLCAVELDDASHQDFDARRRDRVKDAALIGAGVPLVRVPVRARHDSAGLAALLMPVLDSRSGPRPGMFASER